MVFWFLPVSALGCPEPGLGKVVKRAAYDDQYKLPVTIAIQTSHIV